MKTNLRTYELAKQFYRECTKVRLNRVMKNQFERASLSIVLNISEGQAKPTKKDRAKFFFISYGSLKEVQTILELANINTLNNESDKLAAHLWKLAKNPGGV